MIKRSHNRGWHYIINKLIQDKEVVSPKEVADQIEGIHYQKVTYYLRSLGWIRNPDNNDTVLYYNPVMEREK